jgi:hypothetical protein
VGALTDAARAEAVASRQVLLDEIVALNASARSAVDIPGKIKRAPARTAALIGGTAFVALKGPQRLYRGLRRAVLGPTANMPKSMLPKEIDKVLRAIGEDGKHVRGVIEREFAGYLEKTRQDRESRDWKATVSALGGNILRPVTGEAGKRLARELFRPEGGSFDRVASRIRARRDARELERSLTDERPGRRPG